MPDGEGENDFLSRKRQQSIERLEFFLNKECSPQPIRLNDRQVRKFKGRGAVAGWAIQPPDMARRLIVFVDGRYPFSIPKVAVDPAPPPLSYPHIEKDGYLCISEVAIPKNENDLEAVAHEVIAEATDLLKKCLSGQNKEDFKDEILSYWERAKTEGAPECLSLLDLDKNKDARIVKIWKIPSDKALLFTAETEDEGIRWLNQKTGKRHSLTSADALFVWSDKILVPAEYPSNNKQICGLLEEHCGPRALPLFQKLASKTPDRITVVIGFDTDTGKALISVVLEKPRTSSSCHMKPREELTKGFRPGRVHPAVAGPRYANKRAISKRLIVQRVDPSWALARDSDPRIPAIKTKTITIVGCGAIGSEVARLLAQNGVRNFNFIDPDGMEWENTGRHALGAGEVNFGDPYGKASALAHALKSGFPHISIMSVHPEKWEAVLEKDKAAFHAVDLIIMATGDWPAENAMSKYALAQDSFPPILYGWAEAYAAAGHSFAVLANGACFNCAFDGPIFKFKLAEFESELKRLPACGGVFQPFRSIELAPINAVIAAHAIDVLTAKVAKSQIRSWVGSQNNLRENGGKWTPIAAQKIAARGASSGQFLLEIDLDKIPHCTACSTSKEEETCDSQAPISA